jgi:catechol 2,3-dioxygenase-like lactoylglutathione lyase family enzyme
MEMKLELVLIPVTDVDRAKTFYVERLGSVEGVDVSRPHDGGHGLPLGGERAFAWSYLLVRTGSQPCAQCPARAGGPAPPPLRSTRGWPGRRRLYLRVGVRSLLALSRLVTR